MRRRLARDSASGHKGAAVSTSDRRRPRERISTGALAFSQGFEGIVGGTPLIIIEQRGATAIPLRPFSPSPRIPQGISNTHDEIAAGLEQQSIADFRDQYARAREEQADHYFQEMMEIADEPLKDNVDSARARNRIDVRKFAVARLAPKKYGDRVSHDVQGNTTFNARSQPNVFA